MFIGGFFDFELRISDSDACSGENLMRKTSGRIQGLNDMSSGLVSGGTTEGTLHSTGAVCRDQKRAFRQPDALQLLQFLKPPLPMLSPISATQILPLC